MHYHENKDGRDFVVGDIHGHFETMYDKLDELKFDYNKDRLFSVGDLVDRGPDSKSALGVLTKPWFYAIRGNHEQMAIDAAGGMYNWAIYKHNGGSWFIELNEQEQKEYAQAFSKMPVWCDIKTKHGLVGIVHGDAPPDWNDIEKFHEHYLMWGRMRIQRKNATPVDNVYRVYCGHTPLKEKTILGNVHFIDTGACFGGKLTIEQFN